MGSWQEAAWESLGVGVGLKSIAVLGAAWLLVFLLRGRSAAARHLVWAAAFASVLVLPALSVAMPQLRLPINLSQAPIFQTAAARAQASAPAVDSAVPPDSKAAALKPYAPDWRSWLLLLWAAGVIVSLAQFLVALAALWRVRRTALPCRSPDVDECAQALKIGWRVEVLATEPGSMPASCGIVHPAVLLPADATGWSSERRRVVLLHELGHLYRADHITQLVARAALAIYWWNPLAWLAWRKFLTERERATDDLVLSAGTRASDYAGHLLEIARSRQSAPAIGWAAIAMARRSHLENRVMAILNTKVRRDGPGRRSAAAAALTAVALMAPVAALRAQDDAQVVPADAEATIRAAAAQKNHQMLETAARAAVAFGQYDLAQKLLESSLAIRQQTSGQQSVEYGIGLVKLGDLERDRNRFEEAEAFYTKAVSVLGSRPEAAPALIDLGTAALRKKDSQQAIDYFQQAQLADPQHAGAALMWLAVVREQQQKLEEAESLYKQASSAEDPQSAQAATTMELYARFLGRQGRAGEAKSFQEQALAVRRELGAHAVAVRQTPAQNAVRVGVAVRMGAGVTAPVVLRKVEPQYTEEARLAQYQGTVIVSTVIGTDGTAQNMQVVGGLGLGLDEKALQAISQWQFKPGTKDGQPVPVIATIEVNFRLL